MKELVTVCDYHIDKVDLLFKAMDRFNDLISSTNLLDTFKVEMNIDMHVKYPILYLTIKVIPRYV